MNWEEKLANSTDAAGELHYIEIVEFIKDLLGDEKKIKEMLKGWNAYGWKDGEYIDDIGGYFEKKLKELNY